MLKNIFILLVLFLVRFLIVFIEVTQKYLVFCVPLTYLSILMLYFLECNLIGKILPNRKYKHILIAINIIFAGLYTICFSGDYLGFGG